MRQVMRRAWPGVLFVAALVAIAAQGQAQQPPGEDAAVLSADLQNVDLNGIILLSQILSFDNSVDGPKLNPGVDQAYALALPTYAASAFYHKKLPTQPAALPPFLAEVEQFALGDYMAALLQGSDLPAARLQAVATRELRAHRLERALSSTVSSAREYREQLQNFLEGSADAITHVQEGIIVDANRAGLQIVERDQIIGRA